MNKKTNILIVHNYYQIPGGEDTVVQNEKKLLEEYGHGVFLYSRSNSELIGMKLIGMLKICIATVFNIRTYYDIKRLIREKKIDIVHVHNTLHLISPAVYYAALSCRIPIVQTIHNFRLLCPNATFFRDAHICEDCVRHGSRRAVKHSCYRGSKAHTLGCVISMKIHRLTGIYGKLFYICLTDFNKGKLLNLKWIKRERVFVKPNFVEGDKRIVPYNQRRNQFVFVGRLDKLKGIDLLIKTWKKIEDKKKEDAPTLIVCGVGPMEGWCEEYIKENRLKSVWMRGYVHNEEVIKIIAFSKALILPTQWYEGFPMVIVEAYSVGTPVVGSGIGNVGSLIEEGITGYTFSCDDMVRLTEIIESEVLNICSNVKETYNKYYTKESNYQCLNDIYTKLREFKK